jgi:hypothetical protein
MKTLVGFIEHRLRLSQDSSEFIKKKRKREVGNVTSRIGDAGIFFVPSGSSVTKEYLLVVPQALLKVVCDAARFNRRVKLVRYAIIDLDSLAMENIYNHGPEVAVLELGMMEVAKDVIDPNTQMICMNLTDFRNLEASNCRALHSIVGYIDSISPIIAVVPSDPFCLVEVFQPPQNEEDTLSCVLVMKGEQALSCHAGMFPGDKIVINSVQCQRWTVPQALRLKGYDHIQVPNRVLVVSDSKSIIWQEEDEVGNTVPVSMAMVQGRVQATTFSEGRLCCIELTDGPMRNKVFVENFPMSTNLQYGLRKGALVRAINVHVLLLSGSATYFGACLRSTILLVSTASVSVDITPHQNNVATEVVEKRALFPWHYTRIRRSAFRHALSAYLADVFDPSTVRGFSHEDLVRVLERLYSSHEGNSTFGALTKNSDEVEARINRRDQFSEFFDHGREHHRGDATEQYGCHLSSCNDKRLVGPTILSISRLKDVLMKVMEDQLAEWIETLGEGKIEGGSVASLQLRSNEILRFIDGVDDGLLCLIGMLSALPKSDDAFLLGDANCCSPITTDTPFSLPECVAFQNVACTVKVCVVSALCLGISSTNTVTSWCNLEPWTQLEQPAQKGSCALLDFNGYIFIISIHVHCDVVVSTGMQPSAAPTSLKSRPSYTIEQMLDPQQVIEQDASFFGILCRHRLKFANVKSGQFQGTTLTLAHCCNIGKRKVDANAVSTLQLLELKVSSRLPEERKAEFMRSVQLMTSIASGSLLEEQFCLAAAWWKMADGATSALIACGIDEVLKPALESRSCRATRFVPLVVVPTSSLSPGSHGFPRFKCDVVDIKVRFVEVCNIDLPVGHTQPANLTSLGNRQFLRGMIARLSTGRKSLFGEFRSLQQCGMQSATLCGLHQDICTDMRMRSQSSLAPAMVRLVRAARFLGVSFCKVHAKCSRCHSNLVRITNNDLSQPSGWSNAQGNIWGMPMAADSGRKRCRLRCPSHCPSEYGDVVWECSGLLDDGTGQCQLYAERETALALLEIDPEIASTIEAGAWETESGIRFQKTLPPSSFLKHAIRDARANVASRAMGREARAKDVLSILTPKARALFLLHQLCTKVPNAPREHDYVVRCKPLSTGAFRLNRTEVKTSNSALVLSDTVIYSLPPLKLVFVSMLP